MYELIEIITDNRTDESMITNDVDSTFFHSCPTLTILSLLFQGYRLIVLFVLFDFSDGEFTVDLCTLTDRAVMLLQQYVDEVLAR